LLRNAWYYNLEDLADVVVEVPSNDKTATTKIQTGIFVDSWVSFKPLGKRPPILLFQIVNVLLVAFVSIYVLSQSDSWNINFGNGFLRLVILGIVVFLLGYPL
jgi:hypothetical protein